MTVVITARSPDVSAEDKVYAQEKAEKVLRIFNGVSKIELVLSSEGLLRRAEVVLSVVKGETIAVHVDHERLRAAIDLVVDKAEKQLRRHKEKLRDHRPGEIPPTASQEPARRRPDDDLESYQDVVDRTDFE